MNKLKRNILLGEIKFFFILFFSIFFISTTHSNEKKNYEGNFVELKILDKLSSKNTTISLEIGKEKKFKNLIIKTLKCKNSEFDDDPEITAYIQVKDIDNKDNDKVFVFNGWTFSSSPALQTFDHPVYDIWLVRCYN